ncbi:MAG: hypothetical protein KGL39_14265 [Patescibacteria group bacterium]|nr:hypothetical protein [Patescibacteria group bacterium]
MSDWADNKAFEIWQTPGGNSNLRDLIAQALRDVQRETAQECAEIVEACHVRGEKDGDCRGAIRARFGLK